MDNSLYSGIGFNPSLDQPGIGLDDFSLNLGAPQNDGLFDLTPESYGNNPATILPQGGDTTSGGGIWGTVEGFFGNILNTASQTATNAAQIVSNNWLHSLSQSHPAGPAATQDQSTLANYDSTPLATGRSFIPADKKYIYIGGGIALLGVAYLVMKNK